MYPTYHNEISFRYKTLAIADQINNGFLDCNKIENGPYIMEKILKIHI